MFLWKLLRFRGCSLVHTEGLGKGVGLRAIVKSGIWAVACAATPSIFILSIPSAKRTLLMTCQLPESAEAAPGLFRPPNEFEHDLQQAISGETTDGLCVPMPNCAEGRVNWIRDA